MSWDQNAGRSHNRKTDCSSFERAEQIRYLGITLTNKTYVQEEIRAAWSQGTIAIIRCSISSISICFQKYKDTDIQNYNFACCLVCALKCRANRTVNKLLWQSMKLPDVHTNSHLTLTVLQLAFSLRSVSVYDILWYKRHYDFCHCGPPNPNQWSTNCWRPHITPPNRLGGSWKVPGNNGLWRHKRRLQSCIWHGSVAVISGKQLAEEVACCGCDESFRMCWCVLYSLPHPPCLITLRSWITSSHHLGPLGVAWQELRRVLRSAAKLWRCVYSHVNLFEGSNLLKLLSIYIYIYIYIHTHTHNSKQPPALHFRRHQQSVCVITVSTVQLHTVQFVQ